MLSDNFLMSTNLMSDFKGDFTGFVWTFGLLSAVFILMVVSIFALASYNIRKKKTV